MKLGILGTGNIVQDILPMMETLNFEKIYLLGTQRSRERAQNLCAAYHLDGYYLDYSGLLQSDVDAIYVALPNSLHYAYAKEALLNGKHVFLEKPATTASAQLQELVHLAQERHLILTEAMSLHYTPAYRSLRESISSLGDIKLVHFQFCQYSSRYDNFKRGIIAPAFDPAQGGGALMDLNVYNLHAILGLFGTPQSTEYFPNMDQDIDTSGILLMHYPTFQAIAVAAKDCQAPVSSTIQGTKGCIRIQMPMNQISAYDMFDQRGNKIRTMDFRENVHRLSYEFKEFQRMVLESDFVSAGKLSEISLAAIRILEKMRPYAL